MPNSTITTRTATLPPAGFDTLLGWPTQTLLELVDLRNDAHAGDITFPQWLERDAAIRATITTPAPAGEDVRAVMLAAHQKDRTDVTTAADGFLLPPADAANLIAVLSMCERTTGEQASAVRSRAKRTARWLAELGALDEETGLPAGLLNRFAVVRHDALGAFPKPARIVRREALELATRAELEVARAYRKAAGRTEELTCELPSADRDAADLAAELPCIGVRIVLETMHQRHEHDRAAAAVWDLWRTGALERSVRAMAGHTWAPPSHPMAVTFGN